MSDNLNPSRLVQRLEEPSGNVDKPFSPTLFRGATRNVLSRLFTVDYMGNSDFEWELPEALSRMIENKRSLITGSTKVTVAASPEEIKRREQHIQWLESNMSVVPEYQPSEKRTIASLKEDLETSRAPHTATIYILAPRPLMDYARKFIADEVMQRHRLAEPTYFRDSLVGNEWRPRSENGVVGWFEMDNGFMFFSDEKMFRNVALALGVEPRVGPERTAQTDRHITAHRQAVASATAS